VGTTFTMYFPRASVGPALPASPAVVDAPEAPSSAALVALVVDDEPMIRLYIRCMMERLGYSVLEASDGAAALQLCRERSRIDVLLTDVFLPGIQGVLLARELRAVQPRSAFLFMSAYPAETLLREGRLLPGMLSLQKPFSESALQAALEVALGAGGTPPIRSRESL
jgi:CheY-like chemotaxis protein